MFNKIEVDGKDIGEFLREMLDVDERIENKLDSLAKELGYSWESRAVKRMNFCSHLIPCDCPKEEAVLEWYWEQVPTQSELEAREKMKMWIEKNPKKSSKTKPTHKDVIDNTGLFDWKLQPVEKDMIERAERMKKQNKSSKKKLK